MNHGIVSFDYFFFFFHFFFFTFYCAHVLCRIFLRKVSVRTIDTGGAGPVSGILEARRMILSDGHEAVAVVAGDAVSTLDTAEFLDRADRGFNRGSNLPSPCIPHGYNRIAEYVAVPYIVMIFAPSTVTCCLKHLLQLLQQHWTVAFASFHDKNNKDGKWTRTGLRASNSPWYQC